MRIAPLALIAVLLPLGACGTVATDVAGPRLNPVMSGNIANASYSGGPQMAPSSLAGPSTPVNQSTGAQPAYMAGYQPASANTLWQTGAKAFFNDQRASKVGDILTVQIDIDDSAKTSNATNRSKTGTTQTGATALAGFEGKLQKVLPETPDLSNLLEFGSTSSSSGQGSVNRQEKINLTIAALVVGVLPNGNLLIQGKQEVRTNAELRDLTVAGIVRPQDISSTNTVRHTQIAEARISYGGRGDISRVQKASVGQSLVERFSPF